MRCPRCHKPLVEEIGAAEDGRLDAVWCCACGYRQNPERLSDADIRRRIAVIRGRSDGWVRMRRWGVADD